MDTNMGPPSKESVLQAMRSDLGMTRVDDLELENGQRGHTVRTGIASALLAKAAAPPRTILPVASKWKTAIKSGAFDDDDAEAVKGLDRIGGGRLHAANATPAAPAHYFSQQRVPPPGLPPPGFERTMHTFKPNMMPQGAASSGVGHQDTRRLSEPPPGFSPGPPGLSQNRAPVSFQMPSMAPHPKGYGVLDSNVSHRLAGDSPTPQPMLQRPHQSFASPSRRPPPPVSPAREVVRAPRPLDPAPAEFAYKVNIRVFDRLAKGEGVVYLVAPSDSDPETIHIYLEGSKYLEYPIVSMYNYMTTSTDLCPQFKEADGSVTTTRLVFGSQDKIVTFMKELRALKARKPEPTPKVAPAAAPVPAPAAAPAVAHTEKPIDMTVSASMPLEKPDPPKAADKEGAPPAIQPAKGLLSDTTAASRPVSKDKETYEVKSTFNDLKENTTTVSSRPIAPYTGPVLDCGNDGYGRACDLVDLSQAAGADGSRPTTRSAMSSTYAMDLGSLQESLFVMPADAESYVFVDSVRPSSAPSEVVVVGAPHQYPAPESVAAPVVESVLEPVVTSVTKAAPEPCIKSPNVRTTMSTTPTKATLAALSDEVGADDCMESLERLRTSLLEILPRFEEMGRILNNVEEKKRETTAKSVFTNLRSSLGDTQSTQLSSAEQLLRALLATLSKEKPTAAKVADTVCRLRYARDEITRLRDQAAPPPEVIYKLGFLPLASKPNPQKKGPVTPKHTPSSSLTNNKPQSNLSPTARPFQPSPAAKTRSTQPTPQLTSSGPAPAVQPATRSPTAPSDVSRSSISSVLESLTERMSRLTLPDSTPKAPTKGLQGSRWATLSGNIVRAENANRFMGIIPP